MKYNVLIQVQQPGEIDRTQNDSDVQIIEEAEVLYDSQEVNEVEEVAMGSEVEDDDGGEVERDLRRCQNDR